MNNLLFSLLAAATALDNASAATLAETAKEINKMVSAGQIETHTAAAAIEAIAHEVDVCTAEFLADGENVDPFNAVTREICKFNLSII